MLRKTVTDIASSLMNYSKSLMKFKDNNNNKLLMNLILLKITVMMG